MAVSIDWAYIQKSTDLHDKHKQGILKDVQDNYPQFIDHPKNNPEYFVGCGYADALTHILQALICTLPIFKNLGKDARDQLIENFGWERHFEKYTLKNEFKTSSKTIKFLAKNLRDEPQNRHFLQGFIFRPQQLEKVINIVSPKYPVGTNPLQLAEEALGGLPSPASQTLLNLTFEVLKTEKKRIAKKQWDKAKASFKNFSICTGFHHLCKRFQIIRATNQLLKELKKPSKSPSTQVNFGEYGHNLLAHRCQLM